MNTTQKALSKVVSFEPAAFSECGPMMKESPDGQSGVIIVKVGLNFSQPDSLIGQNHVCELLLLLLCEFGPPSLNPM